MKLVDPPMAVALSAAALIAGAGFAAGQIFGEESGMLLVAATSAVWTGWFVRWRRTRA